jgi:hypothetical protein
MNLREFSKSHLPLPTGQTHWRKVFPANLRRVEREVERYKDHWWNRRYTVVFDTFTQEQWERVHAGEVINTEWRDIYDYGRV